MTETDRWGRTPPPEGEIFFTYGRQFQDGDFMIDGAGAKWQCRLEWRTRRRYGGQRRGQWIFLWHSLAPGAARGPGRPVPPYQHAELTPKGGPKLPWTPPSSDPKEAEVGPARSDPPEPSPTSTSSLGNWRLPGGCWPEMNRNGGSEP